MRTDIAAPVDPTLQSPAPVVVTAYPRDTAWIDLVDGTAAGGVDLSSFAASVAQGDDKATIRFAFQGAEFPRPRANQPITISRDGVRLFTGIVDAISGERESRAPAERTCTATIRRRDAVPFWREVRRISPTYSVGMDLGLIARDVASMLGLGPREYDLPPLGISLSHDTTQLADMSAWAMLELAAAPALREPFVDALGRLTLISRDPRRSPDLTLTDSQIVSVERSGSRPPINTFRVKYLDPKLSRVYQRDQVLTAGNLMCAIFQPSQSADVWWSDDHTLRCDNARMIVKQSAVSRLLVPFDIGSEWFEQTSPYGGTVKAKLDPLILALLTVDAYQLSLAIASPDLFGFGSTGKAIAVNIALAKLINDLLAIGYGVYEFKGEPYDDVHAVNEVEAYDSAMPEWAEKYEEMQNDLIPDDSVAQGVAVNELIYRSKEASGASLVIADDPRIEPGDVLGLPDGRRFYVKPGGVSRDLSRGADATVKLDGFMVP